jgi:tetratricopeptide (TPR) repeat protein
VAQSLNGLAELYRTERRFADAERLHVRALAIREKAPTRVDPLVQTLNNLAVYKTQRRFSEAETLYRSVLAMREESSGPDHLTVAAALNALALVYKSQGRSADALPLTERALAIREKVHGPDHPDIVPALNILADLYKFDGRYDDGELLYRRALAIREKALGSAVSAARNRPVWSEMPPQSLASADFFPAESPFANGDGFECRQRLARAKDSQHQPPMRRHRDRPGIAERPEASALFRDRRKTGETRRGRLNSGFEKKPLPPGRSGAPYRR